MQNQAFEQTTQSMQMLRRRVDQILELERELQQELSLARSEQCRRSVENQELRAAHEAERKRLSIQLKELAAHRDSLEKEATILREEKDLLSAQHQQLKDVYEQLLSDRQKVRTLIERIFPYNYVREINNIAAETPNVEVLRLCLESEEGMMRLPLELDRALADAVNTRSAFLQIFPYERYRSLRDSFDKLEDIELANHYIEHGMREGLQIEPEVLT